VNALDGWQSDLKTRRKQMKLNAECSTLRLVGLVIVMSLSSACATVSSEWVVGVCPPVVEYSQAEQTLAADEIATLPQNAVLLGWLSDYSVMRDQAQSCVR
jgi:hypothetical protein